MSMPSFFLAIMFAACLPLIFIMKKAPKGGGGPGSDDTLSKAARQQGRLDYQSPNNQIFHYSYEKIFLV